MIDVLERVEYFAKNAPNRIAFQSEYRKITYRQLWEKAKIVSEKIQNLEADGEIKPGLPIAIYGHKEPEMIVSFIGCVLSEHPYCPLDRSMPNSRIKDILKTIDSPIWIRCEEHEAKICKIEQNVISASSSSSNYNEDNFYEKNRVMYIIFTSGSTGKPKGVEVTRQNLGNFLEWMTGVGTPIAEKEGEVFLNQAPYSFDLSVMDTYTALACGATIASLDKDTMSRPNLTMEFIKVKKINYWISTPSFVDMMLAEKNFNSENYPSINVFFFCGERLTKSTANRLNKAFPHSKIINTYGPTESTVAISSIEIDKSYIDADDELPVGVVKPGTNVYIQNDSGDINNDTDTEVGEILIEGNTVAKGYFKMPDRTSAAFQISKLGSENEAKLYHTGDLGYFKNGLLYCIGRTDLQVKVHGYRMELGDIEANILLKEEVESVCVVPKRKDGKIRSLVAFVVAPSLSGTFDDAKNIKQHLKNLLPEYMVPKKIKFIEKLPMTSNGKADRKSLEEMV